MYWGSKILILIVPLAHEEIGGMLKEIKTMKEEQAGKGRD